ncbi:MAG: hypothetical protein H6Q90_2847 [Deltaproteobacteria bacterium]|nr:hypothetical protein [Deltaproteobacteria bacterium]
MTPYLRAHGLRFVAIGLVVSAVSMCATMSSPAQPPPPPADVSQSIAALPPHVVAPGGVLTLFADHGHARGDRLDLYLVNRTMATVNVPAQDNDVFAKLEVERDGRWQRAQPHLFSDCGNSYSPIVLQPGKFLRLSAYHPSGGSKATVRYKLYGDLVLISNAGPGWFDPMQLAAARADALAMRDGDVATIRVALFGPQGSDRQSVRANALRRLGKLPAATAVPVVEQLLAGGISDDNEYNRALELLHQLAPARLVAQLTAALRAVPSPPRDRLLHELPFLPTVSDPALIAELIDRARDPKSRDVAIILDTIGKLRTPAIGALLVTISGDPAYPEETRQRARYLHAEWFGDDRVRIRVTPVGGYSDGHPTPVLVDVDIENTGSSAIHFDYGAPTEILAFYLTRSRGREMTFLPPRQGVRFLTGPGPASTTRIDLAPHQHHVIRVGVMHYFDLAAGDLSIWVSCKLPGIHTVAQLGGGGAGINPRP